MTLERNESNKDVVRKPGYLNDLQRVGPEKPLGYLPLFAIRTYNGEDPEAVRQLALKRGLYANILSEDQSRITSGALVLADLAALQALLQKKNTILSSSGWPTEPEAFIQTVFQKLARVKTELFDVIADAYADYDNPGRTDIDPIGTDQDK